MALLALVFLLLVRPAHALSVEGFVGPERASVDTMFFHFLPWWDKDGQRVDTRFLLFQRVRASFGFDELPPQFGVTTALSWNPTVLRGFAPVLVGQVLTTGPVAKAGLQYAYVRPRATVFGWGVAELAATPSVDFFLLGRVTWPLGDRLGVSVSAEGLATLPTAPDAPVVLTERARAGLVLGAWQVGPGVDLAQVGPGSWTVTTFIGGFVRIDL